MFKLNYPVKKDEKNSSFVAKGLVTKKYFTLNGAIKAASKLCKGNAVILDKNDKICYSGNLFYNPKFKLEEAAEEKTRKPLTKFGLPYQRSCYFKNPADYNALKIISEYINRYSEKDLVSFVGRNEYGLYIAIESMMPELDVLPDLVDYFENMIIPLNIDNWESEMKENLFKNFKEDYYDAFYDKKYTVKDLNKAKQLWEDAIKDKWFVLSF